MAIDVKNDTLFVLNTRDTTYALCYDLEGVLRNLYWGPKIGRASDFDILPWTGEMAYHQDIDKKHEECSSFGMMRYKETSMKVEFSDGVRDFRYTLKGYEADADTLKITLADVHYPLEITLWYRVHEDENIIEKWRELKNTGAAPVQVERLYSGEYQLEGSGWNSVNSNGTWLDEFKWCEDSLSAGKKVYESLRGSTAHVASPVFILHRDANETRGDVYFGALGYTGNFKITLEATPYDYLQVLCGISDMDFRINLKAGETFATPPVYAGFTAQGFGGMSRIMSAFAHRKIMPENFRDQPLRVLYNSWEATYFNVTCEGQKALAEKAAAIGVELFVVDDGWFADRRDDRRSLGDWYVDSRKFPNGLGELIGHVNGLGMDFGLWIEPEMVNENSDFYRAHPDWIYRYDTRPVLTGRYQYMLDLTNPEVTAYILGSIDRLLSDNNIRYIKWDMNRPIAECASANLPKEEYRSIYSRHISGFIGIIAKLRAMYPGVEFEACASGGGRVDYQCMKYFDEFWVSDNTDAACRLSIQENYSMMFPVKYMRAWVTDTSAKGSRSIPLLFRIHSSMCGALGIGVNLNNVGEDEQALLAENIAEYKKLRPVIQFGTLHRLKSCRVDDIHAVEYVRDGQCVVFVFLLSQNRVKQQYNLKLRGLDMDAVYRFELCGTTYTKSGAYLVNRGLSLPMRGDYASMCLSFEAVTAR